MRDNGLKEQVAKLKLRMRPDATNPSSVDTAAFNELTDLLFREGKISAAMNLVERYMPENAVEQNPESDAIEPEETDSNPLDPDTSRKLFERGLEFADAFLFEEAVEVLDKALHLGYSSFDAYYALAGVYKSLGQFGLAEQNLRKSLEQNPGFAASWIMMGAILKPTGRLEECIAACKKALLLDPECAAAYYDLACYFSLSGQRDKALAALEMAFRKGFTDFDWLQEDGDLAALRTSPEWQFLMQRYQTR